MRSVLRRCVGPSRDISRCIRWGSSDSAIQALFDSYDTDKDGILTRSDFKQLLASATSEHISEYRLERILYITDADRSGDITKDDLKILFTNYGFKDINQFISYLTRTTERAQDAKLMFDSIIQRIEEEVGGRQYLRFPKEIIFVAGAPGSGKAKAGYGIKRLRDINADPIFLELVSGPNEEMTDSDVISKVFKTLLEPQYQHGCIIDGFPATDVQAECVIGLYNLMLHLRRQYYHTEHGNELKRPIFRIIVLFVDEDLSVARQVQRSREAIEASAVAMSMTGYDEAEPTTELTPEAAITRYRAFTDQTLPSLQKLRAYFPYKFIDGSKDFDVVIQEVSKELNYQSSFELDQSTFEVLAQIPEANEVSRHARQELVKRLDRYRRSNADLFSQVVRVIELEMIPRIQAQSCHGRAIVRSENPLFQTRETITMTLDVLAERGYRVVLDAERKTVPQKIAVESNEILCNTKSILHFEIFFPLPRMRFAHKGNKDE